MHLVRNYLKWPLIVTFIGLFAAAVLGARLSNNIGEQISFVVTALLLAVLEISLSFDNAIVNANRLDKMSAIWRRRFLTWGILIAVFGMRIVFPVAIVSVSAWVDPISAVELALFRPDEYALIIEHAHISISAFGGAFLFMVALGFFLDENKSVHWVPGVEGVLRKYACIKGLDTVFVLAVILIFSNCLPELSNTRFLFGALSGVFTFHLVNTIAQLLDDDGTNASKMVAKGGLGAFLYLEVIDASFSFDGVIGAFALTTNILLIMIGLGIGAMYVRAFTIMLVEKQTLAEFRYLEHGAFYSVFFLASALFVQSLTHVPEVVIGGMSVALIALGLFSSIRYKRQNKEIQIRNKVLSNVKPHK